MNDDIIKSYSILTHLGLKCVTKDGEDLTEDLKKVTNLLYDGGVKK